MRQKPDHHKQIIVLVGSIGITLVIFIVWFSFTVNEFAHIGDAPNLAKKDSPLIFIKESVANAYHGIMTDLKK